MGMSASQARLLSITARLSDNEYEAQAVAHAKIRLSTKMEDISAAYLDALSDKKMQLRTINSTGDVVSLDITNALLNQTGYRLTDIYGRPIASESDVANFQNSSNDLSTFLNKYRKNWGEEKTQTYSTLQQHYTDLFYSIQEGNYSQVSNETLNNRDYIENGLRTGSLLLQKFGELDDATFGWENESWTTTSTIQETADETDLARIEAQYQTDMATVQAQDKKFDLQLKQIDTEHSALQTEYDSVKKVIDKNIETSFKIFG